MKFLTNLIFEPQGKHNSSLAYNIKDTVMSADGSKVYFALQDVPAGIALSNTDYWMLQIDLSSSKSAMDEALASFGSYAKEIGMRVKGETAKASGNPVTCLADTGSLLQPVTVLTPKQSGSGEPSPDNIRPISGWDAVSLTAAGLNLAPTFKDFPNNGMTFKETDGKITISGTATGSGRLDSARIILPPGTYTLTPNYSALINASIYMRTPSGSQFGSVSMAANLDKKSTFTVTEPTEATVSMFINSGASADNFTLEAMLVVGSSSSGFETYNGEKHTVQIGQTVYGGKMDWLTGKLVADIAITTLTGKEDWAASNTGTVGKKRFYAPGIAVGILPPPNTATVAEGLACSHYKAAPATNGGTHQCVQSIGVYISGTVYFFDDRYAAGTATEWKAYVTEQYAAGTPIQFTYKLTTPIEIQLTPHIISAVEPEQTNTLYGDGSIEVEYVKPLHVSIDERVAAAVAAAMQN